jgi:hypothetical protein
MDSSVKRQGSVVDNLHDAEDQVDDDPGSPGCQCRVLRHCQIA